jgi:prepilin-type N-terminal cleavage/methylation domain-containing protein
MFKTKILIRNKNGFTLVELMVTVLLTAIAVVSIYRGYTAFSQAADAQQQVMEMQQNLRIGMSRLTADIRRAGINEEDEDEAGFICEDSAPHDWPVNETNIQFTMDLGSANGPVIFATDTKDNDRDSDSDEEDESRIGDSDTTDNGEKIRYYLDNDEDTNNNGVLDPGEDLNDNNLLDQWLVRAAWDADLLPTPGYVAQTIITNVDMLNFRYFDEDDNLLPSPATPLVACPAGSVSLDTGDLNIIDRVEITLVVRTTNEDLRYTNDETYENLQLTPIFTVSPPDHFRRRVFTMSVQIRNNI